MKITTTSGKKLRKPFVIAAAAAVAAVLTVSAGAAAVGVLHKNSVDGYLGEGAAEVLESENITTALSAENEYMKVTADTVVSDGDIGLVIFSVEGINDTGEDFVEDHLLSSPISKISFDEEGEEQLLGSSYGTFLPTDYQEENVSSVMAEFEFKEITKPVSMTLDMGLGSDITMTLDFASNIKYEVFANDEGKEITVTPLNLSCKWQLIEGDNGIDISFNMSDGTVKEAGLKAGGSCSPDDENYVSYMIFGEVIDIENAESLNWCGETFTKIS
jgi:hypothetical protein